MKDDKYMYDIIHHMEQHNFKFNGIINVYAERKNIARPIWIFEK